MSQTADTLKARPGASSAAPPSSVRWHIVALLMALCFISHMNRVSMSVAADEKIMRQLQISPTKMGVIYSAFLLVYTLAMIPGGFFIDRFGPRRALMVMGFGSALFGALTGVAGFGIFAAGQVWLSLVIVRSMMGLVTTPLHPGCAHAVSNWMPAAQRTWANGLVTGAALLGIACTYTVFGALIDLYDWPMAFVITGTGTALLTGWWAFYAKDTPSAHASANASERALIRGSETRSADGTSPGSGAWIKLLKNRSLLLLTLSYAAIGYFQYLFFYWIHYYFDTVLKLGKDESRFYAGLPILAMAVTMPLGGWLADRFQKTHGRRKGRAMVSAGGMLASVVFLGLGISTQEPLWIVTWFTLSLGAVGTSEGPFWLTAVELGGRRGGSAAAIINTGGNGIGLLAPIITPAISAQMGWQWGIGLGGLVCLLGALCWWWIDPNERERPASG